MLDHYFRPARDYLDFITGVNNTFEVRSSDEFLFAPSEKDDLYIQK